MKRLRRILTLAASVTAGVAGLGAQSAPAPAGPRTVVIAELFTSEGCSSCPPADALLRRLIATQPVAGVEVLALGSHVDYWDRLGWRDPFSSAFFSARQSAYDAAVFRSDRIYTPQLVVDGTLEVIGSDDAAVQRTLRAAASRPKATVTVEAASETDGHARVDVRVEFPPQLQKHRAADIVVAVTEDGLVSRVNRGENGGRTLAHSAVVRSLTTAGTVKADEHTGAATISVPLSGDWKAGNLRIVGFVQEQNSLRILGGGSSTLRDSR